MRGRSAPLAISHEALRLRRKCACGPHECEECKKKSAEKRSGDSRLQRAAINAERVGAVPAIVHDVLRCPGQPLDGATRAFFEPRFGLDLSGVRVHANPRAAESARAVNAHAYAVGSNVVFGDGQFQPSTETGKRLLAHELAHVLQQGRGIVGSDLEIGPALDGYEQEADEVANQALAGTGMGGRTYQDDGGLLRRQTKAPQPQPAPLRGSNPNACMTPLCAQIGKSAPPANNAQASALADQWVTGAKACISSGAADSNASHQAEIAQHELNEMDAEAADLKKNWAQRPKRGFANSEFLKWLGDTCKRRRRQAEIEFRYNVLFENSPTGLQWDTAISDWDPVESALAALPDEATWTNPRLLKFHREACHPNDVDPQTGACTGQPAGPLARSFTGGETKTGTGEITIFNEGLGAQPYTRSQKLGLSATAQTIRHEVGHVIANDLAPDKRMEFFEKVVGWIEYPWAWISVKNPPYDNWKAEKSKVKTETGFDDAKLDAWLAGLQADKPVVVGSRTYLHAGSFLRSIVTANLPAGVEFEYARTSRDEYLAELYALATSSPELLYQTLPHPQIEWLKTEVFHTQQALEEISRQAAVGEPQLSQFQERARILFTPQQLKAALNEVLTRPRARTGTVG